MPTRWSHARQCYGIHRLQIDRRTILEYAGAIALTSVLANSEETKGMWGTIAKITLHPGKREEMSKS